MRRAGATLADVRSRLKEPAEEALVFSIHTLLPKLDDAKAREQWAEAMKSIVGLREPVDRFFTDVLVMAEDPQLRKDRLSLLTMLRDAITQIADISEMATDEKSA